MRKTISIIGIIISSCVRGDSQIISTYAGTGGSGTDVDGLPATNTNIGNIGFCVCDKTGNLFFSERVKNRVRKVTPLGVVVTVAGNGTAGYSGDDGPATSAQLNAPLGLEVLNGTLYVCDLNNNRIRAINLATGIINTIAGTGVAGFSGDGSIATLAKLSGPTDVCADPSGNLYVSDRTNRVVRKISGGIISTYAGTFNEMGYEGDSGPATQAKLSITEGVCSNSVGDIFICNGDKIRKVAASTGIISTVAGNGINGFAGDGGMAIDAELSHPFDVCIDITNNILIADSYNHRIRQVSSDGIIRTIAGTGIASFSGDGGAAISANLYMPEGVAFDTCWNLFVGDLGNARVRKVSFNPSCLPISVKDVKGNEAISITLHPNPATETLTITAGVEIEAITILNAIGQCVVRRAGSGQRQLPIDVSHLPAGVYMVKVNGVYAGKMVKQ